MKKNIFSVSLIAMLAVAPFAGAMADTPQVTPTQILATTSYVQGAYNAAVEEANKRNITAYDDGTALIGDGTTEVTVVTSDGLPTKVSDLTNDAGYITDSDIPTNVSAFNNDAGYITTTDLPTNVSDLTNDAGYITNSDIPTNVSAFNNDAGYITNASLTGLATETYADGVASTAETNAKTYADGVASTAETNAKTYADGLADNYQAKGDSTVASNGNHILAGNAVGANLSALDGAVGTLESQVATLGEIVVATGWADDHTQDVTTTLNSPSQGQI